MGRRWRRRGRGWRWWGSREKEGKGRGAFAFLDGDTQGDEGFFFWFSGLDGGLHVY